MDGYKRTSGTFKEMVDKNKKKHKKHKKRKFMGNTLLALRI